MDDAVGLQADVRVRIGSLALELSLESDASWISIVGPSGAGKSTFLRILAGLVPETTGVVRFRGEVWLDSGGHRSVPPWMRKVGWVPQDDFLFPHLSVRRNLTYGRAPEKDVEGFSFKEVVELLDLAGVVNRRPRNLSGGERQRVALGRALLRGPSLLLLDEPFAALDPSLRKTVAASLRAFTDGHGVQAVVVSHDQVGSGAHSDEQWILTDGRLALVK